MVGGTTVISQIPRDEDGFIMLSEGIETTEEDLLMVFGDLIADGVPDYDAIIARCEQHGWTTWKSAWQRWRSERII